MGEFLISLILIIISAFANQVIKVWLDQKKIPTLAPWKRNKGGKTRR